MPRRVLIALCCVAPRFARQVVAQTTSTEDHAPSGSMIGVTVGVPGYERRAANELAVLGLDVLQAKPSRLGVEFALGTIPRLISNNAVVLGGRLNAVLPIAVTPDVWLTPSAGGSMVGGASSDGGGAFPGVNAGIGAILWSGHFGIRTNMTWHHFVDTRRAVWLVEVGFVSGR